MNLTDLIKAVEVLKTLSVSEETKPTNITEYSFIGKQVLIRAHLYGVQVGTVESVDGEFLKLKDSRKLWRWQAKKGIALDSLAISGITDGTKATSIAPIVHIRLDDCCGIIELGDDIYKQIMEWPVAEQE